MTPAQRLQAAARPIWDSCLSHPFVTGIEKVVLTCSRYELEVWEMAWRSEL